MQSVVLSGQLVKRDFHITTYTNTYNATMYNSNNITVIIIIIIIIILIIVIIKYNKI